ncbi:MAG: hypothetical protein K0R90_1332, partial [Oscillospiraceae bacterium]|nr:hypothetical protein [Oscillospiraceae bacterium]
IDTINICLDNDVWGRRAGERIIEKYAQRGYNVLEQYPTAKDYNKDLTNFIELENKPIIEIPDKASNSKRVYAHLVGTKKLNQSLVQEYQKSGSLYQTERTIVKNSTPMQITEAVFVQKDKDNFPVYAIKVNLNSSDKYADFKTEYKNTEQARSYLSFNGKNNNLLVFNNPISMMSHQSFLRDMKKEDDFNYICAIKNIPEAVNQFIKDSPHITEVTVMIDKTEALNNKTNQVVDYRETTFKKLLSTVKSKIINVVKRYPTDIDLNRDYRKQKESIQQNQAQKPQEQGLEIG